MTVKQSARDEPPAALFFAKPGAAMIVASAIMPWRSFVLGA
ncbi:hypothetical protein [Castellaniella caeni]|nr:hypothetical protein [Castellaniella caeni]